MHSSLTLEALDERLRQLEVHVRKLAEAEKRDRDSLAPTPDYAIERPASGEPRPCGCEEAVALRARVAELEGIVDGLTQTEARLRDEAIMHREALDLETACRCTLMERAILGALAAFTDSDVELLRTAADNQRSHGLFVRLADDELVRRQDAELARREAAK